MQKQDVSGEVRQLLSRGDSKQALKTATEADDTAATLSVLGSVRSGDIQSLLATLDESSIDSLMRSVYAGLAAPSQNNCAVLLSWHERIVEVAGEGVIVRVLTHRP